MFCAHPSAIHESRIGANIPWKSTSRKSLFWHLLKMKSFLASQIAQHKPDAPVNTRKLCLCCPILTNLQASGTRLLAGQYQTPNKPHARENEHNDNRRKDVVWFKVYYRNNKVYYHLNSFLLEYFLLKQSFFEEPHEYFVFKCIFILHISCVTFIQSLIRSLLIEFTENDPFLCKPQTNLSSILLSVRSIILATKLCHSVKFIPTNALLKDTFGGTDCRTSATAVCFLRTTLYRLGYRVLNAWWCR